MLFFKQKTAYEMRISDWSSDVCSSDLIGVKAGHRPRQRIVRDGVDGPEIALARSKPARSLGHDQAIGRFLMRDGDVAAPPLRIGPAFGKIRPHLSGLDAAGPVFGIDSKLTEPEIVDKGRSGVRDRIADDLGISLHDVNRSEEHNSEP